MEDLKKRLEFPNATVQQQTVCKVLRQIISKQRNESPLSSSSPKVPEVELLWSFCDSDTPVVNETCAKALVSLVESGQAEFGYVLYGFLGLVPTAKNLLGLIHGIGELLVLQIRADLARTGEYRCPYLIRSPPHPFITILNNKPACWPLLQAQVTCFLQLDESLQPAVLTMLKPFLKFIYLDPNGAEKYSLIQSGLLSAILKECQRFEPKTYNQWIGFLLNCVSCLQLATPDQLGSRCNMLLSLTSHCLSNSGPLSKDVWPSLVSSILCLYLHGLGEGMDGGQLIEGMKKISQLKPEIFHCPCLLVLLSRALSATGYHSTKHLLQTVLAAFSESDPPFCHPVIIGLYIHPVLKILAAGKSVLMDAKHDRTMTLASRVLQRLEECIQRGNAWTMKNECSSANIPSHGLTQHHSSALSITTLVQHLTSTPGALREWLRGQPQGQISQECTEVVVSVLLTDEKDEENITLALDVIATVAKQHSRLAPDFLAVLLYKMNNNTNPHVKVAVLNMLPKIATHKVCIAPVLKTLQVLSATRQLKPAILRLVTLLWKYQDRCFPYLQKMLMEEECVAMTTDWDELVLSRAACIKDICTYRPEQHGADLLPALSQLLNDCTDAKDAVPAALALEGLQALCEAEVVDIRTVWSVISEKLQHDTRPLVISKICKLFSLVPGLKLDTPEYEIFMQDILKQVWNHTQSSHLVVRTAAYNALAAFQFTDMTLDHLPVDITEDLRQSRAVADDTEISSEDETSSVVPGVCYVRLLKQVKDDAINAYQDFLSSLIRQEVSDIPRGVYTTALKHRPNSTSQSKAVDTIPKFLLSFYDKNKQPLFQAELASSLLFSFEPTPETGRDGHPRKSAIVTLGRTYQQMLSTLLQEVPVDMGQWHRCLLLPQAWTKFMERVFLVVIESRITELDLQLQHGKTEEGEEEIQYKQKTAWLWARDKLTDTLKNASRGTPTAQGNSILALAGLAATLTKYMNSLNKESLKVVQEATEYTSPPFWISMVTGTVMTVLDTKYKPKGRTFVWCIQRSSSDSTPSSVLSRACACLALPQLIPTLITKDTDVIFEMMTMMTHGLPGQPKADTSPLLLFHYGLGLGMLLEQLVLEHLEDVTDTQGMVAVWKAIHMLEDCGLNEREENRVGALLGVGLTLSAMCKDGKTESRAHISSMFDRLLRQLRCAGDTDSIAQVLSMAISCIAVSAFSTNILGADRVKPCLDIMREQIKKNAQSVDLHTSAGFLVYGLTKCGFPESKEIFADTRQKWMENIDKQTLCDTEKAASLAGLFALAGSEETLISIQSDVSSCTDVNLSSITKIACQFLASCSEANLKGRLAWGLGQLYHLMTRVTDTKSNAPSSYNYLPDSSVLKAVTDYLLEVGRMGIDADEMPQVCAALHALVYGPSQVLPPINWTGVMSPLMKLGDSFVRKLCLQLAVNQCSSSPHAGLFLSAWIVAPFYDSLENESRCFLNQSLPQLMSAVPVTMLNQFLDKRVVSCILGREPELADSAIQGLAAALKVHDPPQSVVLMLYQTVEKTYQQIHQTNKAAVIQQFCDCLHHIPDAVFDRISEHDFDQLSTHLRGAVVRCCLVGQGHQPITLLNQVVDAMLNCMESSATVFPHLCSCFHQLSSSRSAHAGEMLKVQWMLELMGNIKNIADDTMHGDKQKKLTLAICVYAAAVVLWSDTTSGLYFGIWEQDTVLGYGQLQNCLVTQLPKALCTLLSRSPWEQIVNKTIDCLMNIIEISEDRTVKESILACVLSFRHTDQFKKIAVWSKVYSMELL